MITRPMRQSWHGRPHPRPAQVLGQIDIGGAIWVFETLGRYRRLLTHSPTHGPRYGGAPQTGSRERILCVIRTR
jgi:hypothetical protein